MKPEAIDPPHPFWANHDHSDEHVNQVIASQTRPPHPPHVDWPLRSRSPSPLVPLEHRRRPSPTVRPQRHHPLVSPSPNDSGYFSPPRSPQHESRTLHRGTKPRLRRVGRLRVVNTTPPLPPSTTTTTTITTTTTTTAAAATTAASRLIVPTITTNQTQTQPHPQPRTPLPPQSPTRSHSQSSQTSTSPLRPKCEAEPRQGVFSRARRGVKKVLGLGGVEGMKGKGRTDDGAGGLDTNDGAFGRLDGTNGSCGDGEKEAGAGGPPEDESRRSRAWRKVKGLFGWKGERERESSPVVLKRAEVRFLLD